MYRKLLIPIAALAAGGIFAAATMPTHAVASYRALALRIDLTKQAIRDLPPKGNSAGDLLIDMGSVKHNGKPDGHVHEACTFTFPITKTRLDLQCNEFLNLADGNGIAAHGLVPVDFSKGGPQATTFAITGGTGRYENARGEITTKPAGGGKEVWTLHLLP
jgi:hypothetical protein